MPSSEPIKVAAALRSRLSAAALIRSKACPWRSGSAPLPSTSGRSSGASLKSAMKYTTDATAAPGVAPKNQDPM